LPAMVAAGNGSVVVVGSRVVEQPWTGAGAVAYAASKSAVVAMARATASEVLEHGVRVNAVLPSTLDTPANRTAMPNADPSRWVPLAAAATVIAFLLSDDAKHISGASVPIYGRA
jgi:NAD(P)-dependent dehydrogenase (short-subunit alcohol dehydrogenase family)